MTTDDTFSGRHPSGTSPGSHATHQRETGGRSASGRTICSSGASAEEILADDPCLERDDILAASAYAAQQTNHVVVEVA